MNVKSDKMGGQEEVTSNFRLVSATNSDLDLQMGAARFRRDLLFRLRSIMIELPPPLRNRTSDIPQLVLSQAAAVCTRLGLPSKEVSDEFFETLATYHWPGNVRELLNAVDHAIAMEPHCPTLYPKHLPEYIRMHAIGRHPGGLAQGVMQVPPPTADPQGDFPTLKHYRQSAIERVEKRYLATLMSHCGGDVDTACAVSGIKRARMYQLLKKYEHDI